MTIKYNLASMCLSFREILTEILVERSSFVQIDTITWSLNTYVIYINILLEQKTQ